MALPSAYTSTRSGGVHIEGLAQLQRQLRIIDNAIGDHGQGVGELKGALKEGADIVAREAKARAPYLAGDLFRSIQPKANTKGGYVWGGGRVSTPHFYVQEFGGNIPRYRGEYHGGAFTMSHRRRFTHVKDRRRNGYFFYPALENKQYSVVQVIDRAIAAIIAKHFG